MMVYVWIGYGLGLGCILGFVGWVIKKSSYQKSPKAFKIGRNCR